MTHASGNQPTPQRAGPPPVAVADFPIAPGHEPFGRHSKDWKTRATPSTILVTNPFDAPRVLVPGSLRWAVAKANLPRNQDSLVEITPSALNNTRSINLHAGELRIRSSTTIENASGVPLTIRQGTPNARILQVFANRRTTAVTTQDCAPSSTLALTGGQVVGRNGGGILVDNPLNNLTLAYVNLVGNAAVQIHSPRLAKHGNGGGLYSHGTVDARSQQRLRQQRDRA